MTKIICYLKSYFQLRKDYKSKCGSRLSLLLCHDINITRYMRYHRSQLVAPHYIFLFYSPASSPCRLFRKRNAYTHTVVEDATKLFRHEACPTSLNSQFLMTEERTFPKLIFSRRKLFFVPYVASAAGRGKVKVRRVPGPQIKKKLSH